MTRSAVFARPHGRRRSRRTDATRPVPYAFASYLAIVVAMALALIAAAMAHAHNDPRAFEQAGVLVGLAVGFEEATGRFGRLRIALSGHLKADMTSAWSFAAAIVLPPAYAFSVVIALLYYRWLRQQRPAGEAAHRKLFTAATIVLACGVTNALSDWGAPQALPIGAGAAAAAAMLAMLVAYSATNRLLVTGALLLLGVRGRDLAGTAEDNLMELATLCLGALASLALLHQPWLAAFVILPLALLQRSAVVRRLEVAATIDGKTGLLNIAAWEQLAERELARVERQQTPIALLIVDIDRFKTINDSYGHLAGDAVLKAVSGCIAGELRGYDLVGRFGGEEFVALLPGVGERRAAAIAERLRIAVLALRLADFVPLKAGANGRMPTISIGVSSATDSATGLNDLLRVADAALYRAKGSGRNRVCVQRPTSAAAG
jgi:diguanylate cyclase (GGDEF)-like protein